MLRLGLIGHLVAGLTSAKWGKKLAALQVGDVGTFSVEAYCVRFALSRCGGASSWVQNIGGTTIMQRWLGLLSIWRRGRPVQSGARSWQRCRWDGSCVCVLVLCVCMGPKALCAVAQWFPSTEHVITAKRGGRRHGLMLPPHDAIHINLKMCAAVRHRLCVQ
jgi:hypothetical protein